MNSFLHSIGIIGGAGPMASAGLYKTILRLCQKQYGSHDYHEFPRIILISHPFMRGNRDLICEDLLSCMSELQTLGAGVIGIASHSFHAYLPEMQDPRLVHLIEESISSAKTLGISKALILSAPKTIELKLYEAKGIECVYPSDSAQLEVNRIIKEVASGSLNVQQSEMLNTIIASFSDIDGVILACTELPVVHQAHPLEASFPVLDTLEVLASCLVERSQQKATH